MRGLTSREKRLLALCLLSIFVVANLFVGRAIMRSLGGGKARIAELKNEIAENEMWLEERDLWDRRRDWIDANMTPSLAKLGKSVGNAQGELMQTLQNELFERKLKIDRQSLLEPVSTAHYDEVAVNLHIRGEAAIVSQWLSTLQSPNQFQVIKTFELELDTRSKEVEPQAECQITVARWFAPDSGEAPAAPEPENPPAEPAPEPGTEPTPPPAEGKLELTERS